MKLALAFVLPLALNATTPLPYWSIQLGAIRGNQFGSLENRLGTQAAIQFTKPLSERQDLRFGLEAFWVNGKEVPAQIGNWGTWPLQILDTGTMRDRINAQLLSLDYRFHFSRSGTGPYLVAGLVGGRYEWSSTFTGATNQLTGHEAGLKWGGSPGIGFQFRRTFAIELRLRGLQNAEPADHYLLGMSYRF